MMSLARLFTTSVAVPVTPRGHWLIKSATWLLKTVSAWSRHCAAENCCLSLNNLGEKRCFFLSFHQGVFLWITIIVVARCFVLSRTVGESIEWVTENFYWNALVTEGKENLAALFSSSATLFYEHWSGRGLKWAFIRLVLISLDAAPSSSV